MKGKWIWIIFLIGVGAIAGWQMTDSIYRKENTVVMAGSVAMETFASAIEEKMEPMDVQTEFIGSSAGVEALIKGTAQVAMVSRYLSPEEKEKGVVENIAAYDGIVIIVNRENPVDNLSREQLAGIFSGKITNWKEVGGRDERILPIGREQGSGTRDSFESLLRIEGKSCYSNECDSIGVVKAKVAFLAGAVGYVSMEAATLIESEDSIDSKDVKTLSVEHIFPDAKTIERGDYFLVRPFILATLGTVEEQPEKVQEIFGMLSGEQGVVIFEKAKVVPAKEKEPPAKTGKSR